MKKLNVTIFLTLFISLSIIGNAQGSLTTITFVEGTVPNLMDGFYDGVSSPNFRFFNWSGNPGDDFPFTDSWGAVIDSGIFPDLIGRINFSDPLDFVELDGVINNSDFSSTVEWNVTAFDNNNNQVDFVSIGLFDPIDQNGSLHIFSTLRVEAPGTISKVLISQQAELGRHKGWGLDTLRFEQSTADQSVVPEPATMLLFGSGFLGAVVRRRWKL